MKGSFRDTDEVFAGQARALADRYAPEAERRVLAATAGVGALLAGLDEAMAEIADGRGGVLADEPTFRRKALSLRVRFEAVKSFEQRAPAGGEVASDEDVTAVVLEILCTELHRDVCILATEALGYYALPMLNERPGDNEVPLGGAYARSARKGMLARFFESDGTLDAQRDRLARRLLEAPNSGKTGTGH